MTMKKTLKKMVALSMAMMLTAGALAGCSSSGSGESGGSQESSSQSGGADGEKVLTFGCQNYGDGVVDPTNRIDGAWNLTRYGVGECLFKFNDSMEAEPCLAASCEVSDDHLTWTITLQEGLKFSDGCDVTPSKVKESLDRLKTEGPNGSSTPEKYLEYEAEITADDEANTITIQTVTAYPNLPGNLAYPVMAIVDVEHTTDWNNGVIGTGPYVIESFTDQVGYTLVDNEYYREDVPYDRVELMYMSDASAKAMALRNGQVDLVENITNVADIQEMQNDENFTVDIASGVRCAFSWMNLNGVLGNETLRQAIIMGIDKEAICTSNLIGGLYEAGFSVLPSTLNYGYDTLEDPFAYNVDAAKQLLDDAGIVDTDGDGVRELNGENIVLDYVYYDARLLKEFAQAHHQYLTAIGIEVNEREGSSDDQWSTLVSGDYDLNGNNWTTVGNGDPTEYMANWYSKSNANYCGYANDEYDQLYEQLITETDAETRTEILTRLQQILIDDAAVLVDGYYKSSMIYSSNVGYAHIPTADYYWLTTEIVPAE